MQDRIILRISRSRTSLSKVFITNISTWVLMPFVVKLVFVGTVTTAKHFVYFIGTVHLNRSGRRRGRITTTIHLSNTSQVTAVDDNLCGG